jgi:hypothetical protein
MAGAVFDPRGAGGAASGSSTSTTAMRGLLVSDLHYALKQFDWVQAAASRFDLVVIAGDSLDVSSYVAVEAQIVVVSKYLRRMAERTRLITSSFRKGSGLVNAAGRRLAGPRGENPHRRPYLLVGPISWEAGLDAGLTQHWGLRARC